MTIGLDIKLDAVDEKKLNLLLNDLGKKSKPALRKSLARATTSARKDAISQVSGELTMKKSSISKQVKVTKRPSVRDMSAVVKFFREKSLPNIASFKFKDTRKKRRNTGRGVLVTFRRGEGPTRISRGFVVKGKGGNKVGLTRFARDGTRYRGPRGGKLRGLTGPSPLGVFLGEPGMASGVIDRAGKKIIAEVGVEIEKALR